MGILSWVLCNGAIVFDISASLTKGDKNIVKILAFMMMSNLSIAISYLIDYIFVSHNGDALNGAYSCFLGAAICFVNFFFNRKKKPVPLWLSGIYALAFIGVNLLTEFTVSTVVAIVACLTFVMSVVQDNGKMFRIWTISNCILWCTYDIVSRQYQGLYTHVVLTLIFIAGMLIHDRKKVQEDKNV